MLVGSCITGTICKYENWMPRVARNDFNMREVWKPVCCHGNKIVMLKLWSTFSRMVLQRIKHFWFKLAELSFFIIFEENFANLHILRTWISLEQKQIFENSKQHFSSHAGYLFMFKNGFNRKGVVFIIVAF